MHAFYQFSRTAISLSSVLNPSVFSVSLLSNRPPVLGKLLFILPHLFIFHEEDIRAFHPLRETGQTKIHVLASLPCSDSDRSSTNEYVIYCKVEQGSEER